MKRRQERVFQILLITITFVMVILRFLLNEKGRTNPDSIRYFRTADAFPIIDNTTTPLAYPLFIKLFAYISDEFWASKIVGLLAYLFIVWFAWKKKFYFKEFLITGALFSYVSIFSFSMSENLLLPVVFVFLYVSRQSIIDQIDNKKAIIYLSLLLILMYNIRYSALFFMGTCVLYGLINLKKNYGKLFLTAGCIGIVFVALYQIFFVRYFNRDYIDQFLEIGLKPTSQLFSEFLQGISTSFNPFIHIAAPNGGIINYGIYGLGALNIVLIVIVFIKQKLSETEKFLVFVGLIGILGSYFIQYFYSVNPLDYRLLSPFILSIWLVYFKKLFQIFGIYTFGIAVLSLATGFVFTWLSRGNYLESRRTITEFLKTQKLEKVPIKFYLENEEELDKIQIAELIGTVNPQVSLTFKPKDTLQKTTLTQHKVMSKIKIRKNRFQ